MARTRRTLDLAPALMASAWSSRESPSRTEPSAARAISASASSSASPPSLATIFLKCSISTGTSTRRRSKRWQRDSTVTRHLAHLGGGEDELHVPRRLLQRLQERVEGALGEHVHLVDEVDLVARHHRLVARALDDLADVVDAGVGGGVHLQHVGVPALHDLGAVAAELGHVEGRLVDAVGS